MGHVKDKQRRQEREVFEHCKGGYVEEPCLGSAESEHHEHRVWAEGRQREKKACCQITFFLSLGIHFGNSLSCRLCQKIASLKPGQLIDALLRICLGKDSCLVLSTLVIFQAQTIATKPVEQNVEDPRAHYFLCCNELKITPLNCCAPALDRLVPTGFSFTLSF